MRIEVSTDPVAFRTFEHKGWNAASTGYETVFGPLTVQSADAMLDAARVVPGHKVLDVCCGHGILASAAAQRRASVFAVDFAETMIAAVGRNVPAADCRLGDAQDLPYAESTFDAVVCGFGIIHVPQPDRALAEMRRVLRPGGRIAISVWASPSPTNGFGLLLGALRAHGRLDVALPHGPDIFQFSDQEKMKAALAETGYNDLNATTIHQTVKLENATDFIDAVLQGAVRTKALLLAQSPEALAAINAAVAQGVEKLFRHGKTFEVPMPAVVGSGQKRKQGADSVYFR